MARIYLFPKLGARTGDILTVQRFLNELGHAVELPSEGEKMYGTLLEGPVTDLDGHALIGWHRRTMDWADTLLAIAPLQASALLTAGYFAAQGKRSILLTSAFPPTTAQLMFTDHAKTVHEVLDIIGGEEEL